MPCGSNEPLDGKATPDGDAELWLRFSPLFADFEYFQGIGALLPSPCCAHLRVRTKGTSNPHQDVRGGATSALHLVASKIHLCTLCTNPSTLYTTPGTLCFAPWPMKLDQCGKLTGA